MDSGANSRSDVCAGHRSENVMRHERLDADKQHVTGTRVADTDRNSPSDVAPGINAGTRYEIRAHFASQLPAFPGGQSDVRAGHRGKNAI